MFLKFHIPPARMERLFASFGRQAMRIDRVRRRQGIGLGVGLALYGLATAALLSSPVRFGLTVEFGGFFAGLVAAGLAFFTVGWLVSGHLAQPRHPLGIGPWWGLAALAFVAFVMVCFNPGSRPAVEDWFTRLGRTAAAADVWGAWALAAAGVLLASRFSVWLRLAEARVQLGELEFMRHTVVPLLRDLPQDASCSLVCNPYPSRWTVTARVVKQRDRRLGVYDDVLLDFRAVLPGGEACSVLVSHRRIDKYKVHKRKFKGRKHVVGQRILVERPAAGPLERDGAARFEGLARRLVAADPTCVAEATQETVAGVLRLAVKRKWKFTHAQEQPADKLPLPRATLATVRSLSRFAAGLDR